VCVCVCVCSSPGHKLLPKSFKLQLSWLLSPSTTYPSLNLPLKRENTKRESVFTPQSFCQLFEQLVVFAFFGRFPHIIWHVNDIAAKLSILCEFLNLTPHLCHNTCCSWQLVEFTCNMPKTEHWKLLQSKRTLVLSVDLIALWFDPKRLFKWQTVLERTLLFSANSQQLKGFHWECGKCEAKWVHLIRMLQYNLNYLIP